MSLIEFFYDKLGVKDKLLFHQYIASMALITETGLSLPMADPISTTIALDGISLTAYLIARQGSKK